MFGFLKQITEKFKDIQSLREKHEAKKKSPGKILATNKNSTEKMPSTIEITVSSKTLIKILLVIAVFFIAMEVAVQLKTLLIITVISGFLAMGLSPILDSIEKHKIPRPIAILILYVIFLGILGFIFVRVLPIIAEQLLGIAIDIKNLVITRETSLPFLDQFFDGRFNTENIQTLIADNLASISRNLQNVAGSTFGIISGIFQGLFNFILTLTVLFFILLEREQIGHFVLALFPSKNRSYVVKKVNSIKEKMAEWFRGQFFLMLVIGISMYIGMMIFQFLFGMKYATTIAIVAGVMELFPYIGVTITGILAGLIAVNISGTALIAVLVWMAVIQFLENNFLVPIVMEKAVGLCSAVVVLVLAIGGTLGYAMGGVSMAIVGMIFSVPITASVAIFIQEYADKKK